MSLFFDSLSIIETILFVIAAASTLILVIQTILSFAGVDNDGDFDNGANGTDLDDVDLVENAVAGSNGGKSGKEAFDADGLKLFTMRGVLAFFMMSGWVGFIGMRADINPVISLLIAVAAGGATFYGIARLMQVLMGLHHDGTLKMSNAIGQTGTVYIKIPGAEKGVGKVSVTVQERFCEFDAVTENSEGLKTGEAVYVTDVRPGNVLVVEKASK